MTSPSIGRAADPAAVDVATAMGLGYPGTMSSKTQGESAVFDYDGDGDLDILLSAHNQFAWPLLRNDGSRFQAIGGTTFRTYDRHGCVAADFGSVGGAGLPDGRPDLYCAIGACEGTCAKEFPNELWLQRADGTFVNSARAWGVTDPHGRGREALALDYDRDGLLDIIVLNADSSLYASESRLYRNLGGRFVEVIDPAITREDGAGCGATADIDGDGKVDLVVCIANGFSVLYNEGSGFRYAAPIVSGTKTVANTTRDLDLADINGDGRLDLIVVAMNRLTVRPNVAGTFPAISYSLQLGAGHDVAVGDANGDGAADIYVAQGRNDLRPDVMLLNNGGGASFRMLPLPSVAVGDGDVATRLPNWQGSGRDAFLVTNGRWNQLPGPVQLITFTGP